MIRVGADRSQRRTCSHSEELPTSSSAGGFGEPSNELLPFRAKRRSEEADDRREVRVARTALELALGIVKAVCDDRD